MCSTSKQGGFKAHNLLHVNNVDDVKRFKMGLMINSSNDE